MSVTHRAGAAVAPRDLPGGTASAPAVELLTDAVLALDRHLAQGAPALVLDPALQDVLARSGVDPADAPRVQDLLETLSARLSDMAAEHPFPALAARDPAQRFSLPALAEAFWPSLENLRRVGPGHANPASVAHLVGQFEPQLRTLYLRHSGRSEAAWQATWQSLTLRLPRAFTRYAEVLDAQEAGVLHRVAQAPEGVGVLSGLAGLVTLHSAVSTPLVCASLGLLGYLGLAPLLAHVQGHLKRTLLSALAAEDAAIAALSARGPALRLADVVDEVQPILQHAILGGVEDVEELAVHVAPTLARARDAALGPQGPGLAYAHAVAELIQDRFVPRFLAIGLTARCAAEGTALGRFFRHPAGVGALTALATAPLSLLAAAGTPLGLWDGTLMAALFYAGGATLGRLLASPARELDALLRAMADEERLLAGLFPLPALPAPR